MRLRGEGGRGTASLVLFHGTSRQGLSLFPRPETIERVSHSLQAVHDSRTWADFHRLMPADALPRVLSTLKQLGYTVVTRPDLLWEG